MKKNNKKTIKSGDNKVIKKYKFIEEKLGRYPWTLQDIERVIQCGYKMGFSFDNKPKEIDINRIAEELNNNPISYKVDEFGIRDGELILYYQGKEIDRMHLYQLVKWALDIDSRWNCHWIR